MKKVASFILAFILLVSFPSSAISSSGAEEYTCENAFSDMAKIDSPYVTSSGFSDYADVEYFYYSDSAYTTDYCSRSLLNDVQKKIYDAVMDSPIGTMSVTIDFAHGELHSDDFTQGFLSPIMNALCYDSPYHFFHAGYQVGYQVASTGYVKRVIYNVRLAEVYTAQGVVTTTYTTDTILQCIEELDAVLESLTFDTSNRYNFVKDVHDYLCDTITYPALDSEYYVADCHDAYGALVNKYAVCQGYAEAFKLICDINNIPCVYISGVTDGGGGHAWNAVQMDDGKWYLIDATWNDQGSYLFYDFFLCGLDSYDTYFGGKKFSVSHIADVGQFIPALDYASDYYECNDHYTLFDATYNCEALDELSILKLSANDAYDNNIYYNGIYVDVDSKATGSSFSVVNKSNATEHWSIAVVGDPNGDESIDVSDYAIAVNCAMSVNSAADDTGSISCDLNGDGFVDALDLVAFAKASSGKDISIVLE